MEKYKDSDAEFVEIFAHSIYVDDVTFGANEDDSAFDIYTKAKRVLADEDFNLRKFVSNSQKLQQRIELMEGEMMTNECQAAVIDKDKVYTKEFLGGKKASDRKQQILAVKWNFVQDQFVYDFSKLEILV